MELIQALEDLLWWVQNGLENADMTNRQYQRTVKCKELLLKHIDELKNNQQINSGRAKGRVCLNQHKLQAKEGLPHCKFCGEGL